MGIDNPIIHNGPGFALADSQDTPLLGAIIQNRFFESDTETPMEQPVFLLSGLPYSRTLGKGQMFPVYNEEYGIVELYVNIGGNGLNDRYTYWNEVEADYNKVAMFGPATVHGSTVTEGQALMAADGWNTVTVGDYPTEIILPAHYYGSMVYNHNMPDGLKWLVGSGQLAYAESLQANPNGDETWTFAAEKDYYDLFVRAFSPNRVPASWARCNFGWKIMNFDGREWLVTRHEHWVNSSYGIPVEICYSPTDGSVMVNYGNWNCPQYKSDYSDTFWDNFQFDRSTNFVVSGGWGEENPANVALENQDNRIVVNGVTISSFDQIRSVMYRQNPQNMDAGGYCYLVLANENTGQPSPENWKKVDLYWPKIDPNTGKKEDPFSSWYDPLAR